MPHFAPTPALLIVTYVTNIIIEFASYRTLCPPAIAVVCSNANVSLNHTKLAAALKLEEAFVSTDKYFLLKQLKAVILKQYMWNSRSS
jgi:hypothetical protein